MFQIGNTVQVVGLPTNNVYEIIGDKQNPYDGSLASPFNQPIEVQEGCDFILKRVLPEITPEEGLVPFLHVTVQRMISLN